MISCHFPVHALNVLLSFAMAFCIYHAPILYVDIVLWKVKVRLADPSVRRVFSRFLVFVLDPVLVEIICNHPLPSTFYYFTIKRHLWFVVVLTGTIERMAISVFFV